MLVRGVPEYDGISPVDPAQFLVRIDHHMVVIQLLQLIILVPEINGAVIILKGPHKGQTVGTGKLALDGALHKSPGTICPEKDGIVLFIARNTRVQGIEYPIIIRAEARFFVFPGRMSKQFQLFAGRAVAVAGGQGEAGDKDG